MSYRKFFDTTRSEVSTLCGAAIATNKDLPRTLDELRAKAIGQLKNDKSLPPKWCDLLASSAVLVSVLESIEAALRRQNQGNTPQSEAFKGVDLWGRVKSVSLLFESVVDSWQGGIPDERSEIRHLGEFVVLSAGVKDALVLLSGSGVGIVSDWCYSVLLELGKSYLDPEVDKYLGTVS